MSGFHHPVPARVRRGKCPPARSRDAERCLSPVRSAERWEFEAQASTRRSLERRHARPRWDPGPRVVLGILAVTIVLSLLVSVR